MGFVTNNRRPIFWFLWPRPDPSAPVDGDFVQTRPLRIPRRGPFRWLLLLIGTVSLATTTGSAILAALAAPLTAGAFLGAAVSATAFVLILRGWVVGTYVNDAGVTVTSMWKRQSADWSSIASAACSDTTTPWLGLPLRTRGRRVIMILEDGEVIPTHIYSTSPDLFLRPEAFDMACLQWENWMSSS